MSILEFMKGHHRECDDSFLAAEKAVNSKKWEEAKPLFETYKADMDLHFHREEQNLFPAIEEATGMTQGPTMVMRMEHEQMRALMADMAKAIESSDKNSYMGSSETLMIMMQQHNMREESVLYPMADQVLSDVADKMVSSLQESVL